MSIMVQIKFQNRELLKLHYIQKGKRGSEIKDKIEIYNNENLERAKIIYD